MVVSVRISNQRQSNTKTIQKQNLYEEIFTRAIFSKTVNGTLNALCMCVCLYLCLLKRYYLTLKSHKGKTKTWICNVCCRLYRCDTVVDETTTESDVGCIILFVPLSFLKTEENHNCRERIQSPNSVIFLDVLCTCIWIICESVWDTK